MASLLRPARDLAENWDRDVAAELDAYLNHIEGIHKSTDISDEGHERRELDFVEAALL